MPTIIKKVNSWFFVSDLHGQVARYKKLFQVIREERPAVLLLGGDLLPNAGSAYRGLSDGDFIADILQLGFTGLKEGMKEHYPRVFLILGNDDPRAEEGKLEQGERMGLWQYLHMRQLEFEGYSIYGYACVPPTPFLLKDWERYDVSRYVDPGCISPEEGWRTVEVPAHKLRHATIQSELEELTQQADLEQAIFLFHAPPYQTNLDRADLDGRLVEGVQVDTHVGSMAIRRFIQARQPRITLHGHVHESARLMGSWREKIGRTHLFSAAHDGEELALVRFDPENPADATRELI
ncbi:MAG: hypothetical protein A2Z16_08390 [Chloroflexi bacterium RBG_16_54_18]|nr:MAG: hypothetical protein A2Z16_08390 [Chloroflexi bacterium RBG_16_54_18]